MYIGRFAPSPTGPLHFGSLIAAVGSYLDARRRGGRWLVRIDDLDPPREQAGAADNILRTLEAFGFAWDGAVMYQSRRHAAYEEALARLQAAGLLYPCTCSRSQIKQQGRNGPYGPIYPGTCRAAAVRPADTACSLRLITRDEWVIVNDAIQGSYKQNLQREIGDFNLKRRDGFYAYHLAVAVDDAGQGVTDVVRGCDLLESTPRQIYIQRQLGLPTPRYSHLPVAENSDGRKLSKQTHAPPLDAARAGPLTVAALEFLGQQPSPELSGEPLDVVWQWAVEHWQTNRVPQRGQTAGP